MEKDERDIPADTRLFVVKPAAPAVK